MRTRQTSDYSPTMNGSREQNQAINARREMLGWMEAPRQQYKGTGSVSSSSKKMYYREKHGRVTDKENIPNYRKAA